MENYFQQSGIENAIMLYLGNIFHYQPIEALSLSLTFKLISHSLYTNQLPWDSMTEQNWPNQLRLANGFKIVDSSFFLENVVINLFVCLFVLRIPFSPNCFIDAHASLFFLFHFLPFFFSSWGGGLYLWSFIQYLYKILFWSDWKARADVVKLLKHLKKELTILVVSHDLKSVFLSWF